MEDRIVIKVIVDKEKINKQDVIEWFTIIECFQPKDMRCKKLTKGKFRKYNKKKFYEALEQELVDADSSIKTCDDNNEIWVYKNHNNGKNMLFKCTLDNNTFKNNMRNIFTMIDRFIIQNKAIFSYVGLLSDLFLQNNEDISEYELAGKSLKNARIKKSDIFEDEDIIDIEYNPGHYHIIMGMYFGSFWKMWFGEEYFQYVPKELLKSFKDCYENKQLSENSFRITLYEDPWDFDKEENRERQWSFRKHTGIDEVAERLEEAAKNQPVDDGNTKIEIFEGEYEHGGIRICKYYYNEKDELIEKSKASKIVTYELGKSSEIVWSNTEYK